MSLADAVLGGIADLWLELPISPAPAAEVLALQPVYGSREPDAITLGRLVDLKAGIGAKMRYSGDQNLVLIGPNGKGKGTSVLIPNLLTMSDSSIVVVDPKGELAAVTAPYRRTLGRVVILNPFGVLTDYGYGDLQSSGFNPLVHLDPAAASFNVQAALLAEAMVTVEGRDPHWTQSARALVAALIMYVVIEARDAGGVPTIARVRELLCEESEEPREGNNFEGIGLPRTARQMMKSSHAGLRNKAAQFIDWNREIQSIASTAKIQTEPFDDPEIANDIATDSFDFRDLKREPITVYLILPPDMMGRHSKWLRLVLTSAMQAVMRPRRYGEPKTLFMLDEFFALGHLEIISTVWALVRGYGIQIMPVLQDLNQLKKLYPDMYETFLGMAGAVMSFAPNDMTTAEWLSRRGGETTRKVTSTSSGKSLTSNSGSSGSWPNATSNSSESVTFNEGTSTNDTKTTLISAHRLVGLRQGFMVTMLDGVSNIIPTYAPPYFHIRQCLERARQNPYYLGAGL